MATDKCPRCGAGSVSNTVLSDVWLCGTVKEARSTDCYKRQIARMQPVVDAAIAWRRLSGSSGELIQEIEKYKESNDGHR